MARQAGPLYFTGTIDDLTFYKMEGTYYARKKSSLDRKQFRTDPRFARSRKSAEKFGEASKLASQIYWQLPKEQRGKGVIGKLTGQVGRLIQDGKNHEEIFSILLQVMGVKMVVIKTPEKEKLVRTDLSSSQIRANGQFQEAIIDKTIKKSTTDIQNIFQLLNQAGGIFTLQLVNSLTSQPA